MGSIRDKLNKLKRTKFTGRKLQIEAFTAALSDSNLDWAVLNIFGVGGIGKTYLLLEFRRICQERDVPVALLDGQVQKSVIELLMTMREQLDGKNPFGVFDKSLQQHLQIQNKLRTTMESLASGLVAGTKEVIPLGIGAALVEGLGEDRVKSWLYAHLPKSDANLYWNAEHILTDRFVECINRLAEQNSRIVIMFDVYEAMTPLDQWVRDVLLNSELSDKVILIISGRERLSGRWNEWAEVIKYIELKRFSTSEAKEYLSKHDITDSQLVDAILDFTDRLPLALAIVVDMKEAVPTLDPSSFLDVAQRGNMRDKVVERFLSRVMDAPMRRLVESCAVLRWFNAEVLEALSDEGDATERIRRLKRFSFVRTRHDGFALHDIVRDFLVDDLRRRSPRRYVKLNERAAVYYEQRLSDSGNRDRNAALERLYHWLRVNENKGVQLFKGMFDEAIKLYELDYCNAMLQTIEDLQLFDQSQHVIALSTGLLLLTKGEWAEAANILEKLLENPMLDAELKAHALGLLAVTLRYLGKLNQAIETTLQYINLNQVASVPHKVGQGLVNLAELHGLVGDLEKAEECLTESIEIFEVCNDDWEKVRALLYLDHSCRWQGEWSKALQCCKEAQDISKTAKDVWGLGRSMYGMGRTYTYKGELEKARGLLKQSLKTFRQVESEQNVGEALAGLGIVCMQQGLWDEAERYFFESMEIFEARGTQLYVGWVLWNLGELYRQSQRREKSLQFFERSLEAASRMNYVLGSCLTLSSLGDYCADEENWPKAEDHYLKALDLLRTTGYHYDLVRTLVNLSKMNQASGNAAKVAEYLKEAEQLAEDNCFYDQSAVIGTIKAGALLTSIDEKEDPDQTFVQVCEIYTQACTNAIRYNRYLLDSVVKTIIAQLDKLNLQGHSQRAHELCDRLVKFWQSNTLEGKPLIEVEIRNRQSELGDNRPQTPLIEQIEDFGKSSL